MCRARIVSLCRCMQVGISALYVPVSNYGNPVHMALMCMAQIAPSATGLETQHTVDFGKAANMTKSRGTYSADLLLALDYAIQPATRIEALGQMWDNFVAPWVSLNFTNSAGDDLLQCALWRSVTMNTCTLHVHPMDVAFSLEYMPHIYMRNLFAAPFCHWCVCCKPGP